MSSHRFDPDLVYIYNTYREFALVSYIFIGESIRNKYVILYEWHMTDLQDMQC
jgi:hypothetical protein